MTQLKPYHLDILAAINAGINTVKQISILLGKPMPTVSRRVSELKDMSLVSSKIQCNERPLSINFDKNSRVTKLLSTLRTAQETYCELLEVMNCDFEVVIVTTGVQERLDYHRTRAKEKEYRDNNPATVRRNRINQLKKKVSQPGYFNDMSREQYKVFCKLTRLLWGDILPDECELCGSKENLHIHHKKYCYPLVRKDLVRVCRSCHDKMHADGGVQS